MRATLPVVTRRSLRWSVMEPRGVPAGLSRGEMPGKGREVRESFLRAGELLMATKATQISLKELGVT